MSDGADRVKREDIPADALHTMIARLREKGWQVTYAYDNYDAWIDYARVVLTLDGETFDLEWDNWEEGRVSGPARVMAWRADPAAGESP